MFSPIVTSIALFAFAALCVGGLLWAFVYPFLSGEAKTEKRVEKVATAPSRRSRVDLKGGNNDPVNRRKQIEETLKEIEAKNKRIATNPNLSMQIQQAGLTWTKRTFMMICAIVGMVAFVAVYAIGGNLLVAVGFGFAGALGFPRWFLGMKRKKRMEKFIMEFPNAVDVIVRGVKAGLPLGDCIRIVAQESQEPVRSEFKAMIETQALGIPLADAVERLYERVPTPEANFFGIVVAVQQRSGGNLSEVLGNLAKVLRDRKKMKQKVIALSQEAKASAAIIAALPVIVMMLVYMSSPDYISMLWTTNPGQVMMMGSAIWMTLGVLVMKKMINFDF